MTLIRTSDVRFDDIDDFPYEPSFVDVGEPRMAYVEAGSGEETFLCLHGEPTWGYLYRKMIPTLAQEGRVVVPDLVGFGRSDKYTELDEYSFERHYEWLRSFVEAIDLDGVTLVCQDWGSLLGLPLAVSDQPERFDRIVAANALLTDGEAEIPDVWYQFKRMVETADELDVARVVEGGCVRGLSEEARDAYNAPFPDEASKAGVYTFPPLVPQTPEMPGADRHARVRAELAEYEKPFLALFAADDAITRGFRDVFRELVPTTDERSDGWVDNAGHFIQEDAGEECAERIVEFVRETR